MTVLGGGWVVETATVGIVTIVPPTKPRHETWDQRRFEQSVGIFFSHIEINENGCWVWTGARSRHNYGRWSSAYWHEIYAYRAAWEMLRGRPPVRGSGYELDHQCHQDDGDCFGGDHCPHRPCVNVDHLRIVTVSANRSARRPPIATHCVHGHPFDDANTRITPTGWRACRACARQRFRQRYQERRRLLVERRPELGEAIQLRELRS